MFALLSAALAADIDTITVESPPPYTVLVAKNGDLRVLDTDGRPVLRDRVLDLAGADGDGYRKNHRERKVVAWVLWSVGSTCALGGTIGLGTPVGYVALGGGVAAVATGYGVLYGSRDERLDRWIHEDALEQALARYAGDHPEMNAERGAHVVPLWRMDDKGRLVDLEGHPADAEAVALVLGDEERANSWRAWRTEQRATWTTVTIGGAVLSMVGFGLMVEAPEMRTWRAGAGTAAVGAALTVGGASGLVALQSGSRAERWFTPEELDEAMEKGRETLVSEAEPTFTVYPTLAPGYLGISGTF
jgi:hypothetical protein